MRPNRQSEGSKRLFCRLPICLLGFLFSAQAWLFAPCLFAPWLFAQSQQFSSLSGTFCLDLVAAPPFQGHKEWEDWIRESQEFVLKEASYVFHGMVYGYQVVYQPPDRLRRQDEIWLVMPENSELISPDDLDLYHVSRVGKRFYYSLRKELSRFESWNIQAWQQADKKTLHGTAAFATAKSSAEHSLKPELMIE